MKVKIMAILFTTLLFASCSNEVKNPLLDKWDTPFETPPFEQIKEDNYLPAFYETMKLHNAEIDAIVNNSEAPTFENTIVALENSGFLLTRVNRVFSAMNESMNSDKIQEIAKEIYPKLSEHDDNINMNPALFTKIKSLYEKKDELNLNKEQMIVLKNYYKDFIRGGANLNTDDKARFSKINGELSSLAIQFGDNVLKETNKFELVIDNKDDLAGLPESAVANAAETAASKGQTGKWIFTIQKPSMIPFIQYSTNRALREKIYSAYFMKGDNNDELDNKNILLKIVNLRLERAKLLGFNSHADFVLDEQMAKNPSNVYMLLEKVLTPALKRAEEERAEMQEMIKKEGNNFKLESWDWFYYSEKVKKEKYDLDENDLRPYFEVNNVIKGVFGLATTLFGIQFEERNDIQKYHPDVKVFEVKEADGKHIGILYTDYFPRDSKRSGAWMDEFRRQYKKDGEMITPIIYNVGNFSKPSGDKPALLSLDEVLTLFHEFGHAMHGMLSNCTYESVAGTETPRDFVEFPSQVMENWALQPEVLKTYATHYENGEVIPVELVNKIENASKFNQGFATTEYLAASFLDMDWHTITEPVTIDVNTFENNSMNKIGLIPEIKPRYRSTYFNHIFSGDYSSGYYSYIWAEVLDADAFAAFKSSGDIFNPELAKKYREFILSAGGTDDAMELYKKFRGTEPGIEPLLERRGLN
ncbi:MAG: M3 family metallopeptidase [Bacteroidetes bacterium]|nr:M3 family metallopeptidase [Bacteroidota bacterium]MBU1113719.1 M3 family metallopeptidase [Bacteroidota bacterium]MBU1798074.1 M3 family metallopeptidase [Bacteroidota bacterium]